VRDKSRQDAKEERRQRIEDTRTVSGDRLTQDEEVYDKRVAFWFASMHAQRIRKALLSSTLFVLVIAYVAPVTEL
jgi:hypothetical protein